MAERTCFNCVYCCCDPCLWLRWLGEGEEIVPQCANHPQWPGQLHDVPGVPCRNYRPKPVPPQGDSVRMIALTDGGYAYVDAADYDWLNQWRWHMCSSGYAGRSEKGKTIYMHRQILDPPRGMVVDHIDGNRANNCRANIRACTRAQNIHNKRKCTGSRSRFKCVYYSKQLGKWYSRCWFEGRDRLIGYFDTEIEAARAYDRQAVAWFGEFARLNFPREWPPERRAQVYAQRQETDQQGESDKEKVTSKKGKRSESRLQAVKDCVNAVLQTPDPSAPGRDRKANGRKSSARAGTRGRRERKGRTKGTRRGE